MEQRRGRTRWRAWWTAARVHTLPAGASPVIVGIGIALDKGMFSLWPALAALLGALLIQVGTNFANDYYDAIKGVDTPDREGFTRVTASGLLDPEEVREAMVLTFVSAIIVGAYLVYVGGVPILVIGLLSVAAGIAYTGGPLPFGYRGLGDIFVFVFFGLIAVIGTYYVQAVSIVADPLTRSLPEQTIAIEAVLGGVAMGGLITGILVINNIRDIDEDRDAGKRTLAVMIGRRWSRIEFLVLVAIAYLVPLWFIVDGGSFAVALVYLSLPLAGIVTRDVLRGVDGSTLNPALTNMGRLVLVYAVLFAIGVTL